MRRSAARALALRIGARQSARSCKWSIIGGAGVAVHAIVTVHKHKRPVLHVGRQGGRGALASRSTFGQNPGLLARHHLIPPHTPTLSPRDFCTPETHVGWQWPRPRRYCCSTAQAHLWDAFPRTPSHSTPTKPYGRLHCVAVADLPSHIYHHTAPCETPSQSLSTLVPASVGIRTALYRDFAVGEDDGARWRRPGLRRQRDGSCAPAPEPLLLPTR